MYNSLLVNSVVQRLVSELHVNLTWNGVLIIPKGWPL